MARSRVRVYLIVRILAVMAFLLGITVLPQGVPAGLVVIGAGLAVVLSSLWSNAGGPGERAGSRMQDRWFDSVMPPQGDWPPYDLGPGPGPGPGPGSVAPPRPPSEPVLRRERPRQ